MIDIKVILKGTSLQEKVITVLNGKITQEVHKNRQEDQMMILRAIALQEIQTDPL